MIHVHIYTSRRFIAAESEELRTWLLDPREYYRGPSSLRDTSVSPLSLSIYLPFNLHCASLSVALPLAVYQFSFLLVVIIDRRHDLSKRRLFAGRILVGR